MTDGLHYVKHIASGCGEDVKVLVRDGKIVWFPTKCKCGTRILTTEDLEVRE